MKHRHNGSYVSRTKRGGVLLKRRPLHTYGAATPFMNLALPSEDMQADYVRFVTREALANPRLARQAKIDKEDLMITPSRRVKVVVVATTTDPKTLKRLAKSRDETVKFNAYEKLIRLGLVKRMPKARSTANEEVNERDVEQAFETLRQGMNLELER